MEADKQRAGNAVRMIRLEALFPSGRGISGQCRIVFMSDLHIGTSLRPAHRQAASLVRAAQPRLVILGGDLVNGESGWPLFREWLSQLDLSPVICVPGNWEYKSRGGLRRAAEHLAAAGVRLLRNAVLRLSEEKGAAVVVGIDDPRRGKPDPDRLLPEIRCLRGAPGAVIAACHNPDIIPRTPPWVDLLLCGHTHGGQICLPGRRAILTSSRVGRRYAYGLHSLGPGRYVYVTSGVGVTYLPVRINCPAEIVVLDLAAAGDRAQRLVVRMSEVQW